MLDRSSSLRRLRRVALAPTGARYSCRTSHPHIRIGRCTEGDALSDSELLAELLATGAPGVELITRSFRALGDPTRLRLLLFLLDNERTVGECVTHVGLSQGRVSTHLACLADCGFVQSRRERRFVYYQVTDQRIVGLIELVRSMTAENAAALAQCLRIDGSA